MKTVKQIRADIVSQLQSSWKTLFYVYLPIFLLFVFVGVLSRVSDASLGFLLHDITATARLPFYTGFVSQLGLILWSASLAICLFALVVIQRRKGDFSASKRFLMYSTILTAILLLDDIFLFHEEIAANYLHLDESVVFVVYGIVGIGFMLFNWREILSSEYAFLLLALILLGASIALDALPLDSFHLRYFWEQLELFLEDGFKFAGIATWLMYFARYAIQQIEDAQRNSDTTAS